MQIPASQFLQTTPICDLASDSGSRPTESSMRRTGRKTYKTDKAKKEAIWPDYLESWLLQGINQYFPPPSRSGRGRSKLQRFPRRNKVISEYIYRNTGKFRSPKQVGSRIQQLRATCRDPIIHRTLTDLGRFQSDSDTEYDTTPEPPSLKSDSSSDDLSEPHATPAIQDNDSPANPSVISNQVFLTIVILDDDWSHRAVQSPRAYLDLPVALTENPIDASYTTPRSHLYQSPIFVLASEALNLCHTYDSTFELCGDDGSYESFPASIIKSPTNPHEFSTSLPTDVWQTVVDRSQITHFTLTQRISSTVDARVVMIVTYKLNFTCQANGAPAVVLSPLVVPDQGYEQAFPSSYTLETPVYDVSADPGLSTLPPLPSPAETSLLFPTLYGTTDNVTTYQHASWSPTIPYQLQYSAPYSY